LTTGINLEDISWYYELSGQRVGPVSFSEIQTLVASASITSSTLVWRRGWTDWKAAGDTELVGKLPSTATAASSTAAPAIKSASTIAPNGVKGWPRMAGVALALVGVVVVAGIYVRKHPELLASLRSSPAQAQQEPVSDKQQSQQATVAELPGDEVRSDGSPAVIGIESDSFQTVGGVLRVTDHDAVKQLLLDQRKVSGIEGDFIHLVTAYRFKGRDTVLVTTACGGSSCNYTSFALLDIQADGQVKVLSDEQLTLDAEGATPDVVPQVDGSLLIAFRGFKGAQRWLYANGGLAQL